MLFWAIVKIISFHSIPFRLVSFATFFGPCVVHLQYIFLFFSPPSLQWASFFVLWFNVLFPFWMVKVRCWLMCLGCLVFGSELVHFNVFSFSLLFLATKRTKWFNLNQTNQTHEYREEDEEEIHSGWYSRSNDVCMIRMLYVRVRVWSFFSLFDFDFFCTVVETKKAIKTVNNQR